MPHERVTWVAGALTVVSIAVGPAAVRPFSRAFGITIVGGTAPELGRVVVPIAITVAAVSSGIVPVVRERPIEGIVGAIARIVPPCVKHRASMCVVAGDEVGGGCFCP
jgi:hypothetical protein